MHCILSRILTAAACFVIAVGMGAGKLTASDAVTPPNVVIVLVDDLGWADVGCYGSTYYETPHIDRLAAEGMRFTNGYAACAVCSPTRAAVLTGRYPARIGITDWIRARFQGTRIPPDRKNPTAYVGGPRRALLCPPNPLWMEHEERTIAELLKPAGYVNCHIGKWHLGADDWYPQTQAFDVNIGGCDFGHPPSYFDPFRNKQQQDIPTLTPRRTGEYLTDREADEVVGLIRALADKRFFIYWAPYAVHTPIQGKADLIEKYKAKTPTHQKNATYAAMIESVDEGVGRILGTLDELELTADTLIIFTSDNGGLLGPTSNLPLRSGKGFPYEGGIRVPFIVRWPGIVPEGTVCREPVSSIDLLPTVAAATGAALSEEPAVDGASLMPLLREQPGFAREALFWHFPHYRYSQETPYSVIRAGNWKLIRRYEGPTHELYDLQADLSESTDLAAAKPELVEELSRRLDTWLNDVGAKLPQPNPDHRPGDS